MHTRTIIEEDTMIEIGAKIEMVIGQEEIGIIMDHMCYHKVMIVK